MVMETEGRTDLRDEISDCLARIPQLKRTVGGRKVFHEKIVIERSKKYKDRVEDMILPPLELLYIWNMFHMMFGKKELLEPFLFMVDKKFFNYKHDKGKLGIHYSIT
jgi:hypothetical protein